MIARTVDSNRSVAVVIPCYRVRKHILDVLRRIGPECARVYVIDDCCPEGTGDYVMAMCRDPRVSVVKNDVNLGVGGAVIRGYKQAIEDGATVVVKIDGDGQMAPELIPFFVAPILAGHADYTKGNRFYDLSNIGAMPPLRIFGNGVLSFMSKLSTGYWEVFDPTNGYTAIHTTIAAHLPLHKISLRYFFETDMLFRLNTMRAVVLDIPMTAKYGDEESNLRVSRVLPEFLVKHARNFGKRIFYNYFLRDLSVASLELVASIALLSFGVAFGGYHWITAIQSHASTPIGTVMVAALTTLLGVQFGLSFLSFDMRAVPRRALHTLMPHGLTPLVKSDESPKRSLAPTE